MHKANLIVLILLFVPLVLLIVSYSSYWYKVQDEDNSDNYTALKSDKIKVSTSSTSFTSSWKRAFGDDEGYKNTLNIYKASLAFAVIAWIVNVVAVVFVVFSLLGILGKIPLPLGFITKLLPIPVFVLCVISLFIFVGVPSAMMKDCKNVTLDDICEANERNKKLVGSENGVKWGPIEGWACVVVSAVFSLGASIVSMMMASY
ncbi:hypothetical protein PPL_01854 [Heterostelium album PN500]|uniref:Uncharacterized protein n=1 Tax=Heterostelium pallidum (strain ATCC 26659 / Pp 5 / PN500) TaxID=670386 RepID=D3B0N7_HETP5|nr:hypothetical protein PPL_01854 [Heterostelium album PN500]EFA84861.1 hypothetical protein PPL_01854 [Heterostelium album PN500]|eukprot:XP_020436972.1 hypothetical protein PPL_01854 [Heterostelium album PN500]